MDGQGTVKKVIQMQCVEQYGGNPGMVRIRPSDPDTGIVFTDGKRKARLRHEFLDTAWSGSLIKTIVLSDPESGLKVRGIEHFLSTSWVYELDNALVEIDMDPKLSYKLFRPFGIALRNTVIFPPFPDLEKSLCDRIEEVGIVRGGEKKVLRLKDGEKIDAGKLKLERIEGADVQIRAITEYTLRDWDVVRDDVTVTLVPEDYKRRAHARAYFSAPHPKRAPEGLTRVVGWIHSFPALVPKGVMKFAGNFLYLGYGLGHGVNETNSFYPPRTKKEWREKENFGEGDKGEVAYHTAALDRAGDTIKNLDLAFGARPAGMKLTCKFAGHKDACDFVRDCVTKYADKFYVSEE